MKTGEPVESLSLSKFSILYMRNYQITYGNFTLLLTSSGQEWQFHIATDIYWSRMAISYCHWHLVVTNGNCTLLLTSGGQEWQFHNSPHRNCQMKWPRWDVSSNFQMQYPNELSDIPPSVSNEVHTETQIFRWSVQIRYTLPVLTSDCQAWQFHFATDM